MSRRLLLLQAGLAALVIGGGGVWIASAPGEVPAFGTVRESYVPTEAYLLDRHGVVLQVTRENFAARRLPWIALADVSPALPSAVQQAEDRRFRQHSGVDMRALLGAGSQIVRGGVERGASTITMQVAALLDPTLMPAHGRRTLMQKLRQMRAAWRLESTWSKDQILEAYFNLVGFRGELQGVNAAAHALFGKSPSGLDMDESWLLAALLPSPTAGVERVARRGCALKRAAEPEVSCARLDELAVAAFGNGMQIAPEANLAPHLARQLLKTPGETRRTTLDSAVQQTAIAALTEQILGLGGQNVRDAAALVVDNASGDVLAYVGAVNTGARAPYVDGVRAPRQAGSTLKPFLYGLALEKRYLTAASLLNDSPVRLETGGGLYIPQDYDRDFHGLVSVRSALAGSLNVPAVRTLVLVGLEPFLERLHALGYSSIAQPADYYGFSLALGSAEVTLLEQVNAFRTLANRGDWSPLRFTAEAASAAPQHVMSAEAAYIIDDILSDRGSRAVTFGLDSALATPFWSGVKTGTSKFMRDNWCIGFSSRYTVGVWVGNFDGEAMHDVSGVTGAAPAWLEIMTRLNEGLREMPPPPPATLVSTDIHFDGGIEPSRREWFIPGTQLAEIAAAPAASLKPRLESPPAGMIVAIDPDIPTDRQQVLFRSEPREASLSYQLDGVNLASAAREYFWAPRPGPHTLKLIDRHGLALDEVRFNVRSSR